jgi:thioredoxin-dependent peroxiredoxin
MPKAGDTAPDFELPDQNGKLVRLSDFRGKKVVLFAYPKAGTGGCTTQACGFRDAMPRIEAANTVVLGISPDAPKDLLKWQKEENLNFDLLSDDGHKVLDAWGVWGEKSMYGRKYMGVIRSHWVIDEKGVIIDAQIAVTPANSIKLAVKALGKK